ncbi:MAG: F0F1 ATP synthase subunit gamma [Acidobacteriota bacterium]
MTKKRELKERVESLGDVRDILAAMKNLSLVEVAKLNRFIATQRQVVHVSEEAAADFLSFFPFTLGTQEKTGGQRICLLVGSERGFCGDFNDLVVRQFRTLEEISQNPELAIVVIGGRLAGKLSDDPRVQLVLAAPSAPEEVPGTIDNILSWLAEVTEARETLSSESLIVVYNEELETGVQTTVMRPLESLSRAEPRRFPYPPTLNLPPSKLFVQLADHYLFSVLHYFFYSSLMAEHRQRIRHMDVAIRHLEEGLSRLARRLNSLRQEEITQEIEVIMLSVEALQTEITSSG